MTPLSIFAIVAVIIILGIISVYNGLVRARTHVTEGWADIDIQLKRRSDLIPNLVETVKGYKAHEAGTLEKVTAARASALQAATMAERGIAEAALGNSLSGLFAVAESYPDLKASANFIELQRELADTENKLQAARRFYNGLVRDYNIKQTVFPTNLIAAPFGFHQAEFFELDAEANREPVAVSFN